MLEVTVSQFSIYSHSMNMYQSTLKTLIGKGNINQTYPVCDMHDAAKSLKWQNNVLSANRKRSCFCIPDTDEKKRYNDILGKNVVRIMYFQAYKMWV